MLGNLAGILAALSTFAVLLSCARLVSISKKANAQLSQDSTENSRRLQENLQRLQEEWSTLSVRHQDQLLGWKQLLDSLRLAAAEDRTNFSRRISELEAKLLARNPQEFHQLLPRTGEPKPRPQPNPNLVHDPVLGTGVGLGLGASIFNAPKPRSSP